MTRLLSLAALAVMAAPSAATAATAAERSFSVTGFDRIRIDGPFDVQLKTGVAPFARASGARTALDRVKLSVQGRTLVIQADSGAWGGYPGEAAKPAVIMVGTHDLDSAIVNGAGRLAIDRVKGLTFTLAVQGAGAVDVAALRVDQLKLGLSGAASARLAGEVANANLLIRGTSSLDSSAMALKDAKLGVEGPSIVRMKARGSLSVQAVGPASIAIEGRPACTVKAVGSAVVTGC